MHPVLVLPLNEGSGDIVYDRSGYNNHGTCYNTQWIKKWRDWLLYFNGENAYVDCGNADSLNYFESITIAVWAKQTAWTGGLDAWVLDKDYTGYRIWGLDKHIVGFRSPTQYWQWLDGGKVPELNRWYFLAGVYDADALKIRLYRDDVLLAEADSPEKLNFSFHSIHLRLGRHSGAERYYPCIIGEVLVFLKALSGEQIAFLSSLFRGEKRSPPVF